MKTLITSHRSLLTILRSLSAFIPIALALGAFALSPRVQAVNPPPDGGYAGGNTAEGQNALLNLTTGGFNTAAGFLSLRSNTTPASRQPSALERFSPTPQTTIRPLARGRF